MAREAVCAAESQPSKAGLDDRIIGVPEPNELHDATVI
jgi:hypothetical protein